MPQVLDDTGPFAIVEVCCLHSSWSFCQVMQCMPQPTLHVRRFDDRLEFILPGHVADDTDLMVHFEVWDYRCTKALLFAEARLVCNWTHWHGPTKWTSVNALHTHEVQGVHWPVRRLINTFQGRLDIPLSDVKRQHHMKGEYRLEGVRQVRGLQVAQCICDASTAVT